MFHGLFNVSTNLSTQQIECNLDKWIPGTKMDITFWADDYHGIYESHLMSLTSFGKYLKSKGVDLLGQLQHRLGNYGQCFPLYKKREFKPRLHAGVSTTESQVHQAILQSAFTDAVNDYVAKSETDDDGSGIEA